MAARFVLLVAAGIPALAWPHNSNQPGTGTNCNYENVPLDNLQQKNMCNDDEASLLQSAGKKSVAVKTHAQEQEARAQEQRREKYIQHHNMSWKRFPTCEKDTGGKCSWTKCFTWRGGDEAVKCTGAMQNYCKCQEGYCADDGKCVKDSLFKGCEQDFLHNLGTAEEHASAVVAEHALDTASQTKLDCFLAEYKNITFGFANYSDVSFIYQWKMQLGTPQQVREVMAERRQMMADDNFRQLYDLQNADAVWAYLYSRYYPHEVQEKLMKSDWRETAMMVTMVKMPECISQLYDAYSDSNSEKYFYYTTNPISSARMAHASDGPPCD